MPTSTTVTDINLIASFLAHEQTTDLPAHGCVDCIVLCGSTILKCAETVFTALRERPALAKTLVICGGIGHSTPFLYRAIAQNPKYSWLNSDCQGLPESRVLDLIRERCYGVADSGGSGCRIIVEDKSTNCGANAVETRKVLEAHNVPVPTSIVVMQDPTMSLRTIAGFEKVYMDVPQPPNVIAFPTFVPRVREIDGRLEYANLAVEPSGLWWDMTRFCDLILGEIPRLRDNDSGYGPRGKGFIAHVDIPEEVEVAWSRLSKVMSTERSTVAK